MPTATSTFGVNLVGGAVAVHLSSQPQSPHAADWPIAMPARSDGEPVDHKGPACPTVRPMIRHVIKSANQYPVHTLLSHEANVMYRVPPYQREYSWQKAQWEELFQDLLEADEAHFLGTIITLNQTTDAVNGGVLEVVDGQQRMTTLTLLLAAIYSVLKEHEGELDDDTRTDLTNLGRQIVRKSDGHPRVTPQIQANNLADYWTVLHEAGLKVEPAKKPYFAMRRPAKCFNYYRDSIRKLGESEGTGVVKTALRMLQAVQQAVLVKIEVASHADAFVLFESLNNRGMPQQPRRWRNQP